MSKIINSREVITVGLIFAFVLNILGSFPKAQAQEFVLPAPGVMIQLSPKFNPPILKGLKVHPDNPFHFDFILDPGSSPAKNMSFEAAKLTKYFLASLTIPEKDLWVNLSPYEKNRIIPQSFGQTGMGRDLLAEDYILKQITASLIYPEGETGRKFWKRVYEESARKFGTTNIPVNTFNKVWIVPEKAVVYENTKAGTVYVVKAKLKVMLEEDYLSLQKHNYVKNDVASVGANIVREIIIPELTKEVNEDRNFAQLRQVYNSFILATWYKAKIKDSIFAKVYENKNKVVGIKYRDSVHIDVDGIYQRYLQAFKKGAYNLIKEEENPITGQIIPRKYFSGGFDFADFAMITTLKFSMSWGSLWKKLMKVSVLFAPVYQFELDGQEVQNTGQILGRGDNNIIIIATTAEGKEVAVQIPIGDNRNLSRRAKLIQQLEEFHGPKYLGRVKIKVWGRIEEGNAMEWIKGEQAEKINDTGKALFLITQQHIESLENLARLFRSGVRFQDFNLENLILTPQGEARPIDTWVIKNARGFIHAPNINLDVQQILQFIERLKGIMQTQDNNSAMLSKGMKLFKPRGLGTERLIQLRGGADVLTSGRRPFFRMPGSVPLIEEIDGKIRIGNSGSYRLVSTEFSTLEHIFGIMHRIEYLDSVRGKDKNEPIVIVDWGCGNGRALAELTRLLEQRKREGHEIKNVILYGFANEYDPKWRKAPQGVHFIWDTADHLKEYLKGLKVNLIFSYRGLDHLADDDVPEGLLERHFNDLHGLLDPKYGKLLILGFTDYGISVMRKKLGRIFNITPIPTDSWQDNYPTEWTPIPVNPAISTENGGIDLTSAKLLTVQNNSRSIRFHIDPAQLAQFQDSEGFEPVIINIQSMTNLRQFLLS